MSDPTAALAELLAVMARLRDPQHGCAWDLAQNFATIAPYTLEEAYEVLDAIDSGEPGRLRDELGDLLFQVVFHARMAEERGWFDFAAVASGICAKLVRRHPHVFEAPAAGASAAPGALSRQWEEQKERERAAAAQRRGDAGGVLVDVPRALPALTRASKLGARAARVGFDWPDAPQVRAKVREELLELDEVLARAATPSSAEAAAEEMGDLLFTLVNWSRHLRIDPEAALRLANDKFERRFNLMERLAAERGLTLGALSAAQWDALWCEAKRALQASTLNSIP
jgi:nucleoside triphosphate diphosphatase